MENTTIYEKVIEAVKKIKSICSNSESSGTETIDIYFKDKDGNVFVYGITIRAILDCVILVGGIWGSGANIYINLADYSDDEILGDKVFSHLDGMFDIVEITDIKLSEN